MASHRGNSEQFGAIRARNGPVLNWMISLRHANPTVLYRRCREAEALDTVETCLAGGEYRALTRMRPTDKQVIEQVGNNERAPWAPPPAPGTREVTEYSEIIPEQFPGTTIMVCVNACFICVGSRLPSELGWVVQVGTPLGWAKIL